jgi:hypothetical protein
VVRVAVTPTQKALLAGAARRDGRTLSEWMSEQLRGFAAERTRK